MGKQRPATSPLVSSSASSSKLKGKGRASAASGTAKSSSSAKAAATGADIDITGHAGNINLGNTCFLNSVLQAAAVTAPLQQLLEHQWYQQKHHQNSAAAAGASSDWTDHEEDDRSADDGDDDDDDESRIQRRRKRAAIKGKARARSAGVIIPSIPIGTREAPLSDALRTHLSKAYSHRPPSASSASTTAPPASRKKSAASANSLNPRPLLNALTRKFDQYGDFAQQDAHELLRHLLDACRMEEVDMIKKIRKAEEQEGNKVNESDTEAETSIGRQRPAASSSQLQAPAMSKEASSSEQSTTSSQGAPPSSVSTTSSSSSSSSSSASSNPSTAQSRQSDRPTPPRLVRPSPIPAHLRTDLINEDTDDFSDSDTPILLGPNPLAGSGELTPMPSQKSSSFPLHKSFSSSSQSTPTHAAHLDLSTPTISRTEASHRLFTSAESRSAPKEAHTLAPHKDSSQNKNQVEYRPLIDVVFGGQLASIIVCESCRNIRHTYEDFYDISLPLRDESGSKVSDKSKKRDRIRSMSELWRRAGTGSGASSSANDARALIAKAQLAHDEGAEDSEMVINKRRRGSVAAMSETEASENDASPAAAAGLMERRRLKAEEAKKQKKERRASMGGGGATGAESSAGEERGGKSANMSFFRASSIRKSLGQMSKSSKESVVSASATGHNEPMPGTPPLNATAAGNGGSGNVVEGLERAVASMSVQPVSPGSIASDADPALAPVHVQPQPHPNPPQPSVSPAIFTFWKSARSSSKSPAPSSNSMALSAFDSNSSPDFRSRSASPSRAAAFLSRDQNSRPASTAPADQGHLAPPPANAYVLPAQSAGHPAPSGGGSTVAPTLAAGAAQQNHVLNASPSAPAALSAIEEGVSGLSISSAHSSTSFNNSPMASLLSRTKGPPSSSFTPPSSNQTSPAVLGATHASVHGNKVAGAHPHLHGGRSGRLGLHHRGRGRGPSRQAQYLARILADVCPPSEEAGGGGGGGGGGNVSNGNDRTAPLSAVAESPADTTPTKLAGGGDAHDGGLQRVKSPSAAAALLHRMNGSSPNPPLAEHSGGGHGGAGSGPASSGTHSQPPTPSDVIASEFETGLGRALCQFTKVELLEGENAFKCRRCWRIAHPKTMQERQQRREKERQRRLRQGSKKAGGSGADAEEDEDEEEKRDSSETPSSDLDTSDEDVDAVLELPPAVNRPALTRSNLQMNSSNLAFSNSNNNNNNFSAGSSRRSSVDSDALEVMGASILSAPGKLGEASNLSSLQALTTARPPPVKGGDQTSPSVPSIHKNVPAGLAAGEQGATSQHSSGKSHLGGDDTTASNSIDSEAKDKEGNGSALNGGSSGQQSMTASTASISPRESLESARPVEISPSKEAATQSEPNAATSETSGESEPTTAKPRAASASKKASTATTNKSAADHKKKKVTEAIERRALKRYLIASAPPVLVFHFKRFQSNTSRFSGRRSRPGDFSKIDDPVSFPEFFDVSPWLAPPREEYNRLGALKATSDPVVLAQAKEAELAFTAPQHSPTVYASQLKAPRSPFRLFRSHSPSTPKQEWYAAPPPLKSKAQQLGTLYRLYAVVNHQGNMTGGHYTAYVLSDRVRSKAPKSEKEVTVKRAASSRSHTRQALSVGARSQLGLNVTNASSPDEEKEGTDAPLGTVLQPDSETTRNGALVEDDEPEDVRQWLHVSDATVRPAAVSEVFSSKYVYMLFYERL